MLVRLALLWLLASCRIGFDAVATDDAGRDAGVDAVPCPASYTVTLPVSSSVYWIAPTELLLPVHHEACKADAPGRTHLATLDTRDEMLALGALLDAVPQPQLGRFYVGAVQLPAQTTLRGGWLGFDGEPLPVELWRFDEPDDLDDIEDGVEHLAVIGMERELVDVSGSTAYGAVCECDGKPVPATVEMELQ